MKRDRRPKLIAITGGSGAGKSWLADRLQRAFGSSAARLSLDNFYRDRAGLPPSRRMQINFDHPRAIDWPCVEAVLRAGRAGRATAVPEYHFPTHTRLLHEKLWTPAPLVLVDGLWLLSRPRVRALFDLSIYLGCPAQLRLERRLARDVAERGRTPEAVRDQFWKVVAPMHDCHVVPQLSWADLVLQQPSSEAEIGGLIASLRNLVPDAMPVTNEQLSAWPLSITEPRGQSIAGGAGLPLVQPKPNASAIPIPTDGTSAPMQPASGAVQSGSSLDMAPEFTFVGSMDFSPTGCACSTGPCYG
jgi:uridine kinase